MALGSTVNVRRVEHPNYRWLATYREGGLLRKKYFKRKADAHGFKSDREDTVENHGTGAGPTPAERAAIDEFRGELAEVGLTLREAIESAIERRRVLSRSATVGEISEALQDAKRDKSESYRSDLRTRLRKFCDGFGDRPADGVEPAEIVRWLDSLGVAPTSVANYRRIAVVLFNYGTRMRMCESNPAESVDVPKAVEAETGILTVPQARRLLKSACNETLPAVAIGLFAGVRSAELRRLDWSDIDLESGLITIRAAVAKSAQRRHIKMSPNLAEWLVPYVREAGAVIPETGWDRVWSAARKRAGFGSKSALTPEEVAAGAELAPWPNNALRHSYASYHLAHLEDAAALALQMGHESSGIVFKHYRQLVRPAEAKKFWGIMPAKRRGENKVINIATG